MGHGGSDVLHAAQGITNDWSYNYLNGGEGSDTLNGGSGPDFLDGALGYADLPRRFSS